MEWLDLLLSCWWWGADGRTKTANAADKYLSPVLILVCAGCLVALLLYRVR